MLSSTIPELETTTDIPSSTTDYSENTTFQKILDGEEISNTNSPTFFVTKSTTLQTTTERKRESNHPFLRYFKRLRKIYELDLKILDQIATLLEGVSDELLPQISESLEPLLISQTVNMLDLGQILGYVAQTIHSTSFQLGASTSLGRLDFLKFGR